MEYLSSIKEVVLVGLNPTEQALKHKAVFCQTNGLWEIIKHSNLMPNGIIYDEIHLSTEVDGKYKYFANKIFGIKTNLGYLDLAPDVYEKKSKDVKVSQQQRDALWLKLSMTNVKKIGLLGKRVTRELYPNLKKSKFSYGKIDEKKQIGKNQVEVYCIPFPETVPIKKEDKIRLYNIVN